MRVEVEDDLRELQVDHRHLELHHRHLELVRSPPPEQAPVGEATATASRRAAITISLGSLCGPVLILQDHPPTISRGGSPLRSVH
jgi:hypothetical protein